MVSIVNSNPSTAYCVPGKHLQVKEFGLTTSNQGQQPSQHCTSAPALSGRSSNHGLRSARAIAGTAHQQLYPSSAIPTSLNQEQLARKQNVTAASLLVGTAELQKLDGMEKKKQQENTQQKGKEISTEKREMEMKQSVCLLQGPKRC